MKKLGIHTFLLFYFSLVSLAFISMLSSSKANELGSEFVKAAKSGKLKEVESHLNNGVPVDITSKNGKTALMFASEKGHVEVVKLLLSWNADPMILDKNGKTALASAVEKKRTDVLTLLGSYLSENLSKFITGSDSEQLSLDQLLQKFPSNDNNTRGVLSRVYTMEFTIGKSFEDIETNGELYYVKVVIGFFTGKSQCTYLSDPESFIEVDTFYFSKGFLTGKDNFLNWLENTKSVREGRFSETVYDKSGLLTFSKEYRILNPRDSAGNLIENDSKILKLEVLSPIYKK